MDINPFIHFFQNELSFFTKFTNNFDFFQFIVHLAFIALFVLVLKSRKWRYILCYLLIFLAVRSREVKIFTGTIFNFAIFPFLAIASGAFCILLAIIFRKNKIFAIALFLMIIVVNSIILTPLVIGSFKSNYNYHVYWSQRQHIGEIIQKLSTPEKSILIYPYDIDLYYFAQRYPPDRFTYWYPWIDEVDKYRQERLNSLKTNPPEVIYIGNLYFKGENNYYMRYFPNLLDNYIPVMKNNKPTGVWIIKENQNLLKDINLK